MNLINIIIVSIGLIAITFITIKLIKTLLYFRRSNNEFNKFPTFNKNMLAWSEEIQDELIKHEYLHFCTNKMFNIDKNTGVIKLTNRLFEVQLLKQEIIDKFIDHIPSLKQELREEKINKILK